MIEEEYDIALIPRRIVQPRDKCTLYVSFSDINMLTNINHGPPFARLSFAQELQQDWFESFDTYQIGAKVLQANIDFFHLLTLFHKIFQSFEFFVVRRAYGAVTEAHLVSCV